MRFVMLAILLGGTACASGPSLSQAIMVHNSTKHIVLAADQVLAPMYRQAAEEADHRFPDDEESYKQEMSTWDAMLEALRDAKLLEQEMHLAVDQWQVGADDGRMTRETAACAGNTLKALGNYAVSLDNQVGNWVYASALTLSFQLTQLADGTACPVKK